MYQFVLVNIGSGFFSINKNYFNYLLLRNDGEFNITNQKDKNEQEIRKFIKISF